MAATNSGRFGNTETLLTSKSTKQSHRPVLLGHPVLCSRSYRLVRGVFLPGQYEGVLVLHDPVEETLGAGVDAGEGVKVGVEDPVVTRTAVEVHDQLSGRVPGVSLLRMMAQVI